MLSVGLMETSYIISWDKRLTMQTIQSIYAQSTIQFSVKLSKAAVTGYSPKSLV